MTNRHRSRQTPISLGVELHAAATEFAATNGKSLAEVCRAAIAKHIGKPELGAVVKMGRPKRAAPAKKTAKKKSGRR